MRLLIQIVCVALIAVGAGLYSFGRHLEPTFNLIDSTNVPLNFGRDLNSNSHYEASAACGVGIGFLVFGALGLLISLLDRLSNARFADIHETSAQMFAMAAIWLSIAMILAFGVLRLNWTGPAAMLSMLVMLALICGSATICTALVFGWKPWARNTATFASRNEDLG